MIYSDFLRETCQKGFFRTLQYEEVKLKQKLIFHPWTLFYASLKLKRENATLVEQHEQSL